MIGDVRVENKIVMVGMRGGEREIIERTGEEEDRLCSGS